MTIAAKRSRSLGESSVRSVRGSPASGQVVYHEVLREVPDVGSHAAGTALQEAPPSSHTVIRPPSTLPADDLLQLPRDRSPGQAMPQQSAMPLVQGGEPPIARAAPTVVVAAVAEAATVEVAVNGDPARRSAFGYAFMGSILTAPTHCAYTGEVDDLTKEAMPMVERSIAVLVAGEVSSRIATLTPTIQMIIVVLIGHLDCGIHPLLCVCHCVSGVSSSVIRHGYARLSSGSPG